MRPSEAARVPGERAFKRLWIGQTVAQVGAQVSLLAIPLTAVIVLKATALQMGWLGAAATMPVLLVALPLGVVADRVDPRSLLIAADAGRATLAGLVSILAVMHRLTMTTLFAAVAGAGALTAMFDIAHQSLLPRLLPPNTLAGKNARLEVSRAASQVAGPGLGGALVQWVTAPVAVGVTAATYLGSLIALLGLPAVPASPRGARGGDGPAGQIRAGLAWLVSQPALRAVAGCTATANFFGTVAGAVYVLFAVRVVGLSPLFLGLVYAGQSVGGLAGAWMAPALAVRLGVSRTLLVAAITFSAAPLLVPLAPHRLLVAVPLLAGAGAIQVGARSAYTVTQVSMRQRITPQELLGRCNASMRFLAWIGLPFGFLAGGLAATCIGTRDTLWVAAAGGLIAVLWLVGPFGRGPN